MPIVKNRACKSSPDKVLCYVTDTAKALLVFSRNLNDEISYARQFRNTTRMWNKAQAYESRKYYHAVLAFAREDNWENGGNLTPELAKEIAEQYAAYCWPGHEVVIAIHIDRGHVHAHFIINSVSIQTGEMLHISDKQYRREKDLANKLSRPYGLSTIDWRRAKQKKRQAEKEGSTKYSDTVAEQRIRDRGGDVWKDELREIIDAVKEEADTRQAFETLLAEQGGNPFPQR